MAVKTTVYNYENMALCCKDLLMITLKLRDAKEKAERLISEFDNAYEGEAKTEVGMFLVSLPTHIYRLELFYKKMMDFISITSEAFQGNDTRMTENMER